MSALLGASVATTVLLLAAVVDLLRRHGQVIRRLHGRLPDPNPERATEET